MQENTPSLCADAPSDASIYADIMLRIVSVTKTRTQSALAAVLGIKQSSISDAKRRGVIPPEWYLRLFEAYGVNPDWLKKGTGPIILRRDDDYACEQSNPFSPYGTIVPVHNPRCETGASALLSELTSCTQIAVPAHYAQPGTVVLLIPSDALAPTVRKGAYVGIDTCHTQMMSGEIFAVRMPHEGIILRRLYVRAQESCCILRADNPAYPESRVPISDCAERLVGRLRWVMQTV